MIPILHILGHGGILKNVIPLSCHYAIVWILEVFSYCAVDVFALISGYIGYKRIFNYTNIIYYCLQVMFYTVFSTIIVLLFRPELVNLKVILEAIFPFVYSTYWYFTAYFCLMFFIPYINKLTGNMKRKDFNTVLIVSFVVFSLIPTLFQADPASLKGGYSFVWITILYMFGSYIKKYEINRIFTARNCICGYISCCLITYISKILIDFISIFILGKSKYGNLLLSYVSPTIIFAAFFLVVCFSNIKVNYITKKFLDLFAPVSFGVYLFHEEPLIKTIFIRDKFISFLDYNPLITCFLVLITALCIWLIGSCLDMVRKIIFNKIKVRDLAFKTINWFKSFNSLKCI